MSTLPIFLVLLIGSCFAKPQYTPAQSKFCEEKYDCVHWEKCVNGFIVTDGGAASSKPSNYESLRCGTEGHMCCGIPGDLSGLIDALLPHTETGALERFEPPPSSCGHSSYDCVPYFQCVDGKINTDGEGLIDVRVRPTASCSNPEYPDVPAVCCLKPDHYPTPEPIEKCPNYKDCVDFSLCSAGGNVNTDGSGVIDIRTGYTSCYLPSGIGGICCTPPSPKIDACPVGGSLCLPSSQCRGQALDSLSNFIQYNPSSSALWTECSLQYAAPSNEKAVCCILPPPPNVDNCPGNSVCSLSNECRGQGLNEFNDFVDYRSAAADLRWTSCSYGGQDGVCCILPPPPNVDNCPGNSVCSLSNECRGQGLNEFNDFIDYRSAAADLRWTSCSYGGQDGVCCIPPPPPIVEYCPQDSLCILGQDCLGNGLDEYNNFVDYLAAPASSRWTGCTHSGQKGICCIQPPVKILDKCPGYSVCVNPEECAGTALNVEDVQVKYSSTGDWAKCRVTEYSEGICCVHPPPIYPVADKCGVRHDVIDSGLKTRIQTPIQINEANFGEFPWQAIIFYQNYTFVCGASLISHKHVLTAAHCVDGLAGGDLRIRFGEWQVNSFEEPLSYEDKNVHAIYIHPDFNPNNVHNDIAVMELVAPIKFKYHINTVCLPNYGQIFDPQTPCFATGWGKDSFEGTFQHVMKLIDLPYIDKTSCQSLLRQTRLGKYFRLDSSFMCAGGEANKDACYGDGGGPLVCQDQGTGQYVVVGVTSWGIGCGRKNVPGVYADVQLFKNWVDEIVLEKGSQNNAVPGYGK